MWQKVISIIENNHSFVLTSHTNPDCDALGSELAMAEYLQSQGKQVAILNSDPVPAAYRFLDDQGLIQHYARRHHRPLIDEADVILVLDASGGWRRVGRIGKALGQARAIKMVIDHHPDSTDFVDVAVSDTEAAATAELVYDLLQTVNSPLTYQMAQALYAGIITDTGNFHFPKTTARTHRIAADLLAHGVNPTQVYHQLYEQYSLGRARLKGEVLSSIKTSPDKQVAYYSLKQSTLKSYGVTTAELDGFASLGQEINGVRVTIFCLELAPNRVKVSFRSDGSVAINRLALEYQGGGHTSAAGAIVGGSLEEVMPRLVEKAQALLLEK